MTVVPRSAARLASISMISVPVLVSRLPVGSSARITRGSTESARAIATRCCSPPERCDGRWVARSARPTSASRASARSARVDAGRTRPARASTWMFSSAVSVGIRLNCWKTNPNERSRSSARSPSRMLGEIAPLEEDVAAGGPIERAEELKERRLPGAARAFESDELTGLDAQVDALERVDHERAAIEGLADAAELVLAHSTVLRASAGRRRAARKAPAAPARRPPTTASPKPASRIVMPTGAESETASEVGACGLLDAEEVFRAPVVELAVSVGPKTPTRTATPMPSTTPRTPPSTPCGEGLARNLTHDLALRPPERLESPELAHPLADRGEGEQRGEQERSDGGDDREREAQAVGEVRGVDERAADRAGDLLRARDLRLRVRRLDALLDGGRRTSLSSARTSTTFTRFFCPRASGAAPAAGRRRRPGRRAAG